VKYVFETDRGLKRSINQDCCNAFALDEDTVFAVVCDGMGGASAGEIASEIAVETISERIRNGWRDGISDDSIRNLMLTSVTAANINVYDYSLTHPGCRGMGTTVAAVVLRKNRGIAAHAGDSRVYLFSDHLFPVTKDHSLVQDLVDQGKITEEEAKTHPQKNYITRALGVEEYIDIDFNTFTFDPAYKVLICSDGLYNFVSEADITRVLLSGDANAAKQLVALANNNGGGDNITAVIISQN
jgi:protein phosphatase